MMGLSGARHGFGGRVAAALPGVACVLALACARPAGAQTVGGRVVDADGGAPVLGAFVVLVDSAGHQRAAVLSDSAGRFLIQAPRPGRYRLRVERLGMATLSVPFFTLAAGERVSRVLSLSAEAVPLAALVVPAKRRCRLHPAAGEATARVWEEVRKALRVSEWARSQGGYEFALRRHERLLSLPGRVVLSDSVLEGTASGGRSYQSLPAGELARNGYVRREPDGSFVYYGPDEAVLASDDFLDTHCLELRPLAETPAGALAVDFHRVDHGGPSDIEGTVWLDRATGELRSIDFRYVDAPVALPGDEAGGSVAYRRLPSGAWVVDHWRLLFPVLRRALRPEMQFGKLSVPPADQLTAVALHETSGEIVDVQGPGTRPTSGATGPPRGGAGEVTGVVFDSLHGRPLAGAHVYLGGTVYAASADEAGRFRITAPPGRYSIAFLHPALDSLPVLPAVREVVVDSGRATPIALAIPGAAELRRRACRGEAAALKRAAGVDPAGAVLFGQLIGGADEGTHVQAVWHAYDRAGPAPNFVVRTLYADAATDAGGRYVVCGIPADMPVVLRAVRTVGGSDRVTGPEVTVTVPAGALRRVDLTPPRP